MTWRRWLPICLVGLIFILPWVLAIYFFWARQKPVSGSMRHGQLVSPAVPLTHWQLMGAMKQPLSLEQVSGEWHLLYIAGTQCDNDCRQHIFYLRQIQKALGRYRRQLQTEVLDVSQNGNSSLYQMLQKHYPSVRYWRGSQSPYQYKSVHAPKLKVGGMVLVDPHGRVMMTYEDDTDPDGVLKDVERLVKTTLTAADHDG